MFILLRIIIVVLLTALVKIKIRDRKKLVLTVCLALTVISLIPFENMFMAFHTPEEAFLYNNSGIVRISVQGRKSAIVFAEDDDGGFTYAIIPAGDDGWKISSGTKIKTVKTVVAEGFLLNIEEYKPAEECYAVIINTGNEDLSVNDNYSSRFEKYEELYVAYIGKFDEEYKLFINGTDILH